MTFNCVNKTSTQQTQNICITIVQMLYKCFVFAGFLSIIFLIVNGMVTKNLSLPEACH